MAILHDDELRTYYDRKRQESKAHGTALGAVCRKLITYVYIVLIENRPYKVRTKRSFLRFDLLPSKSRSFSFGYSDLSIATEGFAQRTAHQPPLKACCTKWLQKATFSRADPGSNLGAD